MVKRSRLFQRRKSILSSPYPLETYEEIQGVSKKVAEIVPCDDDRVEVFGDETEVIVDFHLSDGSKLCLYLSREYGSFNSLNLWKNASKTGEHFSLPDDAYNFITNSKQLIDLIVACLPYNYAQLKEKLITLYKNNGGKQSIMNKLLKSSPSKKENEDALPKVFTPFGVLVGDSASKKAFDAESFYNEVLMPSEKAQYEKFKKDFIKNPKDKTKKVSAGFLPWNKLIVQSKARNYMMLNKIMSNTWALNKDAIPGFVDLVEKLRSKYSTVLGDDKLLEYLEAAQHRAQELKASGEVDGSSSKTPTTNSSLNLMKSASDIAIFNKPLKSGFNAPVSQAISHNSAGIPVQNDKLDTEPSLYVGSTPVWIEEGYYSDDFGRHEGYIVSYESPVGDWVSKLSLPIDSSLDDIEDAVMESIKNNLEFCGGEVVSSRRRVNSNIEGVDQQAYNNYVQQLVATGIPEDQARQMADQLVNQIRQNTAQFAQNIQQPSQSGKALAMSFRKEFIGGLA